MVDNVEITAGSGTTIATDDSGTGQVQLVKLAQSGNGSRTHVTADDDGLRVKTAKGSGVTSKATATSTSSTLLAANASRLAFAVKNYGAEVVFITLDGTDATTDDWPLGVGESYADDVTTSAITGITASGSVDVRVIEVS